MLDPLITIEGREARTSKKEKTLLQTYMQGGDMLERANQLDQWVPTQNRTEMCMSSLLQVLSYIFFPSSGPSSHTYSFLVQKWTLMLFAICSESFSSGRDSIRIKYLVWGQILAYNINSVKVLLCLTYLCILPSSMSDCGKWRCSSDNALSAVHTPCTAKTATGFH